jgi:hypothetical protein
LKCKQVEANVQPSDPTSLLLFFLKKGGSVMNVEKGTERKIYTGIWNVKPGERETKLGKSGEIRRARNMYLETM